MKVNYGKLASLHSAHVNINTFKLKDYACLFKLICLIFFLIQPSQRTARFGSRSRWQKRGQLKKMTKVKESKINRRRRKRRQKEIFFLLVMMKKKRRRKKTMNRLNFAG